MGQRAGGALQSGKGPGAIWKKEALGRAYTRAGELALLQLRVAVLFWGSFVTCP